MLNISQIYTSEKEFGIDDILICLSVEVDTVEDFGIWTTHERKFDVQKNIQA
jgi:hypothetical protein